ncbi:MAG: aminotransferase class IV [Chlamydiia bacterium]|nr:aminotransferase class IV [Chlamydiia bacterium]
MSPLPFALFKGKIVPIEEATVSIASHSLQYGSTSFTGMRGLMQHGNVHLFRLEEHHARMENAMKLMGWDFSLSFEEFKEGIEALIQKNAPEGDFYIRPFVFTATTALKMDYTPLTFEWAVYLVPFGALFDPNKGLKMKVSPWKKFSGEAIPTQAKAGGAYLNSCLAHTDALQNGFDDALMQDQAGNIVEASAANLLIRVGERLISPPRGEALDGITLQSVIEILQEEGKEVKREEISLELLEKADEILVLGTAAQVQFVESWDHHQLDKRPGELCLFLRKTMQTIQNTHPHWVTRIEQC